MQILDLNSEKIKDIFTNIDEEGFKCFQIPFTSFLLLKQEEESEQKKILVDIIESVENDEDFFFDTKIDGLILRVKSVKDRSLLARSQFCAIIGECQDLISSICRIMEDSEGELVKIALVNDALEYKVAKYTADAFNFISKLIYEFKVLSVENKEGIRVKYEFVELKDPQEQVRWCCLLISWFILKYSFDKEQAKKKNANT